MYKPSVIIWLHIQGILLLIGSSVCGKNAAAADLVCVIEEQVLQRFVQMVFPLSLTGKKDVEADVLGIKTKKTVPWKATVTNPKVEITAENQAFSADVSAQSVGTLIPVSWKGKVEGRIDIRYDESRKAFIVNIEDAIAPVRLGPLMLDVDVSKDVPDLPFELSLPEYTLKIKDKTVSVKTEPNIAFADGEVRVEGKVVYAKE